MTIDDLLTGSSAYFFQRGAPVTKVAVRDLFARLRETVTQPGPNLFRIERFTLGDVTYSAICFAHKRTPSFVRPAAKIFDTIHCFMLIVEKGAFLAIIKSGLEIPSSFKTRHLKPVGRGRVERAVATAEAKFEQLALRGMSASKQTLRSKTLEASDLANAMPMASASRFIPRRFRVRRDDGHFAATPSTGRIAKRADRAGYELLLEWAADVIDHLAADDGEVAPFIRNFARSIDLHAVPADVKPSFLSIDVPELADRLFGDDPTIRFVTVAGDDETIALDKAAIDVVLAALDESFPVRTDANGIHVRNADDTDDIGLLKFSKRIALPKLKLAEIDDLFVERLEVGGGGDVERKPLRRYIDNQDLFLVLFTDLSLAYVNGELFRDEAMLDGGADFMRHIIADAALTPANDEKGAFAAGATQFADNSVFRILVDALTPDDAVLICDDLGDEWADFIGLDTDERRPSITFYHAKHGNLSLGAKPFHISVSQAEKNLGRLPLPPAAMEQKFEAWQETYNAPGVATAIPRIVRGGPIANVQAQVERARSSPEVSKRVVIVTSSLSRAAVQTAFDQAAAGAAPTAHFVQLYWLLTSYFSACAEVGAVGYVMCRP